MKDLRNRPLAALDAIRDPYAPIAPTGKGETGNLGRPILNSCDTFKMAECVLGHAAVPAEDAGEERLRKGVEPQNVLELCQAPCGPVLRRNASESPGCGAHRQSRAVTPCPRCPADPFCGGVRRGHKGATLYQRTQDPEGIQVKSDLALIEGDRDCR